MDKKILILVPIWGRKKITEICLDNLKELQKDFNIEVLCVVSERWAKMTAFEHGFKHVEVSNDDLGHKMNVGVERALQFKFDYLMNLGSDDIITKELFKCYEPYFKRETQIFGSTRLTFIDSESKEAKTFDYEIMIGAGRCIRKDVLEDCVVKSSGVDMYTKGKKAALDMDSMKRFNRYSNTEIENPFDSIYDIKSKTNIWSYGEMRGNTLDFDKATRNLTTKQLDSILEL